jgi:flagellar motility protein MotE (MotC chaperone)
LQIQTARADKAEQRAAACDKALQDIDKVKEEIANIQKVRYLPPAQLILCIMCK